VWHNYAVHPNQKFTGFFPNIIGKEYSKGDSRYVARDAGVVTVEGLTAVLEGPASLLAV
jgi:cholestenol delta-isomerase